MIMGESNGQRGTVILQNAETIQLIGEDGLLIPVTNLKVGDWHLELFNRFRGDISEWKFRNMY